MSRSAKHIEPSEILRRLRESMNETYRDIASRHPKELKGLTDGQTLTAGLFVGCLDAFHGVYRLLDYPPLMEEALNLVRTIVEDSTTLAYFQKNASKLEEMRLRFDFGSVQHEIDLFEHAKAVGLGKDREDRNVLDNLYQARDEIELRAQGLGIGKTKALPNTRSKLDELAQPTRYWMFKRASHSKHTTRLSMSARLRKVGAHSFVVGPDINVRTLVGVVMLATDALLWGYEAASLLLSWQTPAEIEGVIKRAYERLIEVRQVTGLPWPDQAADRDGE